MAVPDEQVPDEQVAGVLFGPGSSGDVLSRSAAVDPDEPLHPGAARTRALIRLQLRTALTTGGIVMTVVTGLPVLLDLAPPLGRARVQGVPLSWLVLAIGIQPIWIVTALRHLRRAERAERDLTGRAGPS